MRAPSKMAAFGSRTSNVACELDDGELEARRDAEILPRHPRHAEVAGGGDNRTDAKARGGVVLGLLRRGDETVGRAHADRDVGLEVADQRADAEPDAELPTGKKFELTYSILLRAPARRSNIMELVFDYDGASRRQTLFLSTARAMAQFAEQQFIDNVSNAFDPSSVFPLPIDRSTQVKVVVDLEPTPQRLTVTVDNTTVVDRQALRHDSAPTAPRLDGAVAYAQEGAAYTIDFDDVRVDVTP